MPIETNTITAYTLEDARQTEARRFSEEMPPTQPHSFAASFSIAAVPGSIWVLPNPIERLSQSLRLSIKPDWRAVSESLAVGLRQMRLSRDDVAELRHHEEHPTALPKLPLHAAQVEDVDHLV